MPHSTRIQAQLDQLINAVKEGRYTDFEPLLVGPMNHVLNFDPHIPVVLACTELSLVFQNANVAVRYVDSLDCLALRCFDLAGVTHQSPRWLSAL
jgi:Aspartate racemase